MFGRKRTAAAAAATAAAPAASRSTVPHGFVAQTVLVAAPDVASLRRLDVLAGAIAAGMNGSSAVVGHDYGSPERSVTGPISSTANPVGVSLAAVKGLPGAVQLQQPELADAAGTSELVDPRAAMLWDRMNQL